MDTELRGPAADPNHLSERQARLIIENAVDYAIVGIDLAGRMTSWNVGAERIMGWSAQETIGQTAELFFTPEDVAANIPATEMRAAVRHGRGIDEASITTDLLHRIKGVLLPGETQAVFIRKAVERELQRRECARECGQ